MKKLGILVLLLVVCLGGCVGSNIDGETGAIALNLDSPELQTLFPNIEMVISTYDISGAGPGGKTFAAYDVVGTSFSQNKLAFGEWTITVKGKNAAGIVIGQGQSIATVHSNQTTTVGIVVRPLVGPGRLDVTVNWTATDTEFPAIDSELVPPTGVSQVLDFTITNGDTATYSNSTIQNGYYSLIVKLMDNGALTMGAVEVVRIVQDGITSGFYDFTNINRPGGNIIVNITPEMNDPIDVTMTGQLPELAAGDSMIVTAGVPANVGNVTYVWYINGESKNTGSTFTVSDLEEGFYRLDVTAFTIDGSRAGSATHSFTVTSI